ncbi:MAG: NFACT RNA binding domain-containing protein [Deferribacteraceae bacterium]|jgi:predicted ribosome quality control (RQC) complex YloA/Tae2 family protein|nr:NFACT RNA binding domain-containing protein [Deferribacteraceae bacterium]
MDGLTFHKILKLLDRRYRNAVLNRLSVEGSTLYLSLYKDGEACALSFCASQPPALAKVPVAIGETAGALKSVTGSIITAIEGRNYDRLGFIRLNKRKPSGKTESFTIVLEPMGKHANAFLLNSEGMIQFNLTVKSIDSDRDIGVGKNYLPPKINKKYSLDKPLQGVSFLEYLGFYPPTAKIADTMVQMSGFENTVARLIKELNNGGVFYKDRDGRIFPFQDTNAFLAAVEFEKLAQTARKGGEQKYIAEKVRNFYLKGAAHYAKAGKRLKEELAAAGDWEKVQAEAELIKANIYKINGKGIYNLVHYGEDGEDARQYRYDSEKPPLKYMEELFKKCGKLRRSIPHLEKRIAEVTQLEHAAEEQLYYIETAEAAELKEVFQLLKKDKTPNSKITKQEFHKFSYNGANIFIGKNSTSNYKLVFRFANQGDIWLHAHNIPSAHAVIRMEQGRAGKDIILYAAALVAYFSKHSGENSVEVDYTLRKYVKKPQNTPPGYVTYTCYKTVNVSPVKPEE